MDRDAVRKYGGRRKKSLFWFGVTWL